MKKKTYSPYLVLVLLLLSVLACNLASEAPPTLAPNTPISTITPEVGIQPPPIVTQPTPQPFNITPIAPGGGVVPQAPQVVVPASIEQVDVNRMLLDIQNLVNFETRHVASTSSPTKGINAAKTYLVNEFEKIKATNPFPERVISISEQQFYMDWSGKDIYPANVMMAVTGTDASAGVVIVTAHYDTALADWSLADAYQPGANDNASGVSAVLELARVVMQKRYRATVVFVLFAAEETRRQGSLAFVNEYIAKQNIPVVAVINMDIIGNPSGRRGERYDFDMRLYSQGPNENSNSRFLARMIHYAATHYIPGMNVNIEDSLDRSGRWGDHQSFSDVGYPAIRLIEQADDATVAHTTRDTIDKIDPAYLRRTTQVAMSALEIIAGGQNAPTLKPLRPSATDPASLKLEWSYNPLCSSYVIAMRRPGSLVYDDFYTVDSSTLELTSGAFKNYEAITVSCIDQEGHLGRFAPELLVPRE